MWCLVRNRLIPKSASIVIRGRCRDCRRIVDMMDCNNYLISNDDRARHLITRVDSYSSTDFLCGFIDPFWDWLDIWGRDHVPTLH